MTNTIFSYETVANNTLVESKRGTCTWTGRWSRHVASLPCRHFAFSFADLLTEFFLPAETLQA